MAADYLRSVLSAELSPYRVVTRDAPRFPELSRRYREVAESRASLLVRDLDR
jgi:hypothetical protein